MTEDERDLKILSDACERIGEHFDTIQIFATRHEHGQDGGTRNVNWGCGNWFARYGQVQEWIIVADENTRKMRCRKEDL